MSRLQTKCLVASTALHAAALILLLVSPIVFVPKQRTLTIPVLSLLGDIPVIPVDEAIIGGGNPNARPPAAAPPARAADPPAAAPPASPPPPARAKPAKPETPPAATKAREVEPPKPTREPVSQSDEGGTPKKVERAAPKRAAPTPSFTSAKPSAREAAAAAAQESRAREARAAAAAQKAYSDRIASLSGRLEQGLSTGTSVEIPGPGGPAYAHYGTIVRSAFERAWVPPSEVNEHAGIGRAKIVIRRDGTVEDARLVKGTGSRAVDQSIERALQLRSVGSPFPEGSTDLTRTFFIHFDLKTKNLL